MSHSEKDLEKGLRSAGFRLTRQRKAILKYLASTDAHPSVRRIFQEANKDCRGISLATVYNTVDTLVRAGLIKVMDFQRRNNRHETNLNPHINLICMECGKIQDFGRRLPASPNRVIKEAGFEVKEYRVEYYGICSECRALKGGGR